MSDHWVSPFLDALRTTGVVARSCAAAGVSTSVAYARRREDADFAAAWDNALEDSYDVLEAEARRRAVEGVHEPVVYQGQLTPVWARDANGDLIEEQYDTGQVYPPNAPPDKVGKPIIATRPVQARDANGQPVWLTINKRSDALLQFLLKGYRKRFATDVSELTGAGGGPVQVQDATQRAARIAALVELARQRQAGTAQSTDDLA